MQIIGHRGASGYAPENTLKAFELALSQGCEWLELDVHLLDGKLIVIHDEQLDRTTSGQGLISDHSLDAIRRLDAGDGEKIPYLDEVIEMVDGQASINIELKGLALPSQPRRCSMHGALSTEPTQTSSCSVHLTTANLRWPRRVMRAERYFGRCRAMPSTALYRSMHVT